MCVLAVNFTLQLLSGAFVRLINVVAVALNSFLAFLNEKYLNVVRCLICEIINLVIKKC